MKKLFLGLALSIGFISLSQAQNVNEITKKILDACGKADNVTYDFFAYERFAGTKKVNSEVHIRFQESPLKIYADSKKPTAAKLLYIPSVSADVKVKKGILSISPSLYSGIIMKDQHHPLNQAGFGTFKKIIEQSIKTKGYTLSSPELGSFVKILGTVTYDEKSCWKVEINDNDYKLVSHKVTADEKTVWDLGRKYSVPEYRIKEINDIGNDLTEGQVIKMPSVYAKKTTVFIDKTTFLPIYQKMEDDAGIYEVYEFKNLKINVKFTDDDFKL
jgi:outer membrane lipoprotein-sorting protein